MEHQLVPVGFPFKQSHEGSHAKVLGVQMGGTKENCKEHTNYHPKSKPTEIDGKNWTNPLKELYRIKNSSLLSNLTSNSSSPSSGWTPPSSSNTVALLEVPSKLATAMRSPAATENPYFRYSGWNATILHCHRCYPWYDHWGKLLSLGAERENLGKLGRQLAGDDVESRPSTNIMNKYEQITFMATVNKYTQYTTSFVTWTQLWRATSGCSHFPIFNYIHTITRTYTNISFTN